MEKHSLQTLEDACLNSIGYLSCIELDNLPGRCSKIIREYWKKEHAKKFSYPFDIAKYLCEDEYELVKDGKYWKWKIGNIPRNEFEVTLKFSIYCDDVVIYYKTLHSVTSISDRLSQTSFPNLHVR